MFLIVLDELMKERKINKNTLSKESGVPYTTIDGFYKKGFENVKLSTLKKLSSYFDVSLDYLVKGSKFSLTEKEKEIILAYRSKPEMQSSVDKLLDISDYESKTANKTKFA